MNIINKKQLLILNSIAIFLAIFFFATPAIAGDSIASNLQTGGSYGWIIDLWRFCLSLINIALIGILIYLGIVNILHLNYETYELKKFLSSLVIAVILANFSLFICRSIVEFSDVLTNTFFIEKDQTLMNVLNGLGFAHIQDDGIIGLIEVYIAAISIVTFGTGGIATYLFYLILGCLIALVIALCFFALAILMSVRTFIIYALAATAPLAFISMVLPSTQKYFSQWWGWFLRWVFLGPIVLFIIKIASIIGESNAKNTDSFSGFAFLSIIGLLALALYTPWIIGGSIFGKITGAAKTIGNWATDNTFTGRRLKAYVGAYGRKRKGDLEYTEKLATVQSDAVTENLYKGSGWSSFQAGKEEAQKLGASLKAERFSTTIRNKEQFDKLINDKKFIQKQLKSNPQMLRELILFGAKSGFVTGDKDGQDGNSKTISKNINEAIDSIYTKNDEKTQTQKQQLEKNLNMDEIVKGVLAGSAESKDSDRAVIMLNDIKYKNSLDAIEDFFKNKLVPTLNSVNKNPAAQNKIIESALNKMVEAKDEIDRISPNDQRYQNREQYHQVIDEAFSTLRYRINNPNSQNHSLANNPKFRDLETKYINNISPTVNRFIDKLEIQDETAREDVKFVLTNNLDLSKENRSSLSDTDINRFTNSWKLITDKLGQKPDANQIRNLLNYDDPVHSEVIIDRITRTREFMNENEKNFEQIINSNNNNQLFGPRAKGRR